MFENFAKNSVYKNYINGEWIISKENQLIDICSPIDGSLVRKVSSMSTEEVDNVLRISKEAQKDWVKVPLNKKGQILNKVADYLVQEQEYISEIISREVGKDRKSAISEVLRTADFIRFTIEAAKNINGEVINGEAFDGFDKSKTAIVKREPLGVILAISPFNYPINLAISKIVPALISGNSVVLKPATQGCISALHVIKMFELAGLPKGVLNTITGRGSVIGDYVVTHPLVDMINFTGSSEVGIRIANLTGKVPLLMELGGKDAAIVLEDADLEKAANEIVKGAFSYSGQRCTAIKRVLVVDEIADNLIELLKNNISKLKVGNPLTNNDIDIVPLIDDKSAENIYKLIEETKNMGATLVIGGEGKGRLIEPTLFDNITLDMRLAWEEPFGPILPVIRVKDMEDAIKVSNESNYGLQASIFTNDINKAFTISNELQVGTVQINGKTERGPDNFPFLGVKDSGIGVQGIRNSIESMTRVKVVVVNL